ncbi:TetR family transcriptional regulator (plasmid) [Rhodococcus sp. BH4]|uniref:TetR family transcriptional regulator n=1 Tax=Rhodococcus sp. BH4 TaxID=1807790 RepID=UPI0009C3C7DA|nr:TetR family transcriptional regulator [Rhodococcus sp. BH4]ARE37745.1 TetR family transcriptional regulator [Rhodococcus sp. BH4]
MPLANAPASPGAHVGARVRKIRGAAGVSLRELARRLAVSPATITALETGRTTMSVNRLHQIAVALDVSPNELFANGSVKVARVRVDARVNEKSAEDGRWREFDSLDVDDVLRAALAGIGRMGYHGCSIRDIAEEANSSVSALYHYYPSKQAILVALFDLTMTELLRRATVARDECEPSDPIGRFSRLVECLALFNSYRQEMGFLISNEMRSLEGANHAATEERRTALQRMIEAEVRAGVELGVFLTARPYESARAVLTMCVAIAEWYDPASGERPEEIASVYVRFALDLVGVIESDDLHRGSTKIS